MGAIESKDIWTALGGVIGGGLGLEVVKRWLDGRTKRKSDDVTFQAKILDDGDKLRESLLEETRQLRLQLFEVLERCHKAEVELAVTKNESGRLQLRLERKDEANKALQNQIVALGQIPVSQSGPAGKDFEKGSGAE